MKVVNSQEGKEEVGKGKSIFIGHFIKQLTYIIRLALQVHVF